MATESTHEREAHPALAGGTAAHLITFAGDGYASLQNGPELVAALERAA